MVPQPKIRHTTYTNQSTKQQEELHEPINQPLAVFLVPQPTKKRTHQWTNDRLTNQSTNQPTKKPEFFFATIPTSTHRIIGLHLARYSSRSCTLAAKVDDGGWRKKLKKDGWCVIFFVVVFFQNMQQNTDKTCIKRCMVCRCMLDLLTILYCIC